MSPAELESYLHTRIPLSAAMAVSVVELDTASVALSAPLAPNVNHRGTVFGGSAAALGMLAAWSLLHIRLRAEGMPGGLVVHRTSVEYRAPLTGEFKAHASLVDPDAWHDFVARLERRGKARIDVRAVLEQDGRAAGELLGEFVALADESRAEGPAATAGIG